MGDTKRKVKETLSISGVEERANKNRKTVTSKNHTRLDAIAIKF